jgi:hypothetical protein
MHASFAQRLKPASRSWHCEDSHRPILPWLGQPAADAGGPRSDVAGDRMMGHSLEAMASSRPTSTSIQPPVPETDQPALSIGPSDAPKIALPKNLAQTLQFLSDDDLEALRASVEIELARRLPISAGPITGKASAVQPPIGARTSSGRKGERDSATAVPAGKVSLIRASYHAGMKPAAIARTLRVSLSVVNEVLSTEPKTRP